VWWAAKIDRCCENAEKDAFGGLKVVQGHWMWYQSNGLICVKFVWDHHCRRLRDFLLAIATSCWYAGTSSEYLRQGRISRSSGKGQGHKSNKACLCPVRGCSASEWKEILLSFSSDQFKKYYLLPDLLWAGLAWKYKSKLDGTWWAAADGYAFACCDLDLWHFDLKI